MPLSTIHSVDQLRRRLLDAPDIVFVPTMGNLHAGHLALIREARRHGQTIVSSIFVNRLQFGAGEDFQRYPRTLDADIRGLESVGCDVLFAPDESELYPEPQTFAIQPCKDLSEILEGAWRPGFFTGVCTVVHKLFNIVQPQVAMFGKKDYQQWRVISLMVKQMALPIRIIGVETSRADDGLALSSRNGYLNATERSEAPRLFRALCDIARRHQDLSTRTRQRLERSESEATALLTAHGWKPDYVAIRRQADLLPIEKPDDPLVVLCAARLGSTRLIDNLEF